MLIESSAYLFLNDGHYAGSVKAKGRCDKLIISVCVITADTEEYTAFPLQCKACNMSSVAQLLPIL